MADLTIEDFAEGGLAPSYVAAAAGGDAILNLQGDVVIHVKNAGVGAVLVGVTAQDISEDVPAFGIMSKASVSKSVAADADEFFGPFSRQAFNDANGKAQITYDQVTSVTIAALRLKRAS